MTAGRLFVTIVLDGVGIGAQPDAELYGDAGADTLGHVCQAVRPSLPNLAGLGLGCIRPLDEIPCTPHPGASYGRMQGAAAGKDSTSGHWELGGLTLRDPFPTYPNGFPDSVIASFRDATGVGGVLGNRAASGTVILDEIGDRHVETGHPIVYTSADSVFQIAAHVGVVPLETLYDWCEVARRDVCVGSHAVGRVIARPFEGQPGAFQRLSNHRRDLALPPTGPTLPSVLAGHRVRVVSVGKVADLFAGVGFETTIKTTSNEDGIRALHRAITDRDERPTFVWANLVDFDQDFGHRNDPEGFGRALEAFDQSLPDLLAALPENSRLLITADHGNDPTTLGTDHSREFVPVLYRDGRPGRALGTRATFEDHAATVASWFDVPFACGGRPF